MARGEVARPEAALQEASQLRALMQAGDVPAAEAMLAERLRAAEVKTPGATQCAPEHRPPAADGSTDRTTRIIIHCTLTQRGT